MIITTNASMSPAIFDIISSSFDGISSIQFGLVILVQRNSAGILTTDDVVKDLREIKYNISATPKKQAMGSQLNSSFIRINKKTHFDTKLFVKQ